MIALPDLAACFEGVIPSIVATAAADGMPNISYLSHVVMIDADHVALSNQFFSKTAANIQANPRAALLLVDPRNGEQFRIDLVFLESRSTGEVFQHVKTHLDATSAQVGMADIMRLRAIDIYRVTSITQVPSVVEPLPYELAVPRKSSLEKAVDVVESVTDKVHVDDIVDAVLDGLCRHLAYEGAMLLHLDTRRSVLTTIGSRGYDNTGVGSEVLLGDGIIGNTAAERRLIKVSDMSRVKRLGTAIRNSSAHEERTRTIALPGMPDAMSQIGVPMIAQGMVYGVLFAESRQRLAFSQEDEKALSIIARQTATALILADSLAGESQAATSPEPRLEPVGRTFKVTHYVFDDSIFIDNLYVIKGVPGRLLVFMLETLQREERNEFTNRELRLSEELRLPDIKDNLETRLLLLRRRLTEKSAPIQLVRTGRGCNSLQLCGGIVLEHI